MTLRFGTSGLRGLSSELIGPQSSIYAAAFCKYLENTGAGRAGDFILVGRDYRESSPQIAEKCIAAIAECGFVPVDCGEIPTPALCLHGLQRNAGSIMITGSHIPADRNGMKFYLPKGEITKSDEEGISYIASNSLPPYSKTLENYYVSDSAREGFVKRNTSILPEDCLRGMNVCVYQHSTVARKILRDVISYYGANVTEVGFSEEFVAIDTEDLSTGTRGLLKQWCLGGQFDAVVSADGDGDRPLVTDEYGVPLKGDFLGLLTSNFLEAKVVVTPITSNSAIEHNGDFTVIRTKVGSPYVIEAMQEAIANGNDRVVGFEANGGFLTATPFLFGSYCLEPLLTRDSFLPILLTLYLAKRGRCRLSEVAKSINFRPAAASRLQDFPQYCSTALMSQLSMSDGELSTFLAPIGRIIGRSHVDGLRVTLDSGDIVHLRQSGNAPEMRCYVESDSPEGAQSLLEKSLALLTAFKENTSV